MIYRRGKKGTCWYRFRFAGRIIHESARTTSKTLAREAERQRRRGLAETFNGIQKRTLPPTLSQAAKVWIEKRAGLTAVTRTTYEAALAHATAKLGTMLASEVTAQRISDYQSARLAEGAAGATINKEVTCIGSILSDLGHWHSIRRDVKRLPENEPGRALGSAEERVYGTGVRSGTQSRKLDAGIHRQCLGPEHRDAKDGNSVPTVEGH